MHGLKMPVFVSRFCVFDGGTAQSLSRLQGYKDMYDDNSSQPQTWLAAAEVRSRPLAAHL